MKYILFIFLTSCASLLPDTYVSGEQYEFCSKACISYGGIASAGKTMLGDKKSCLCKNRTVIDYETKVKMTESGDE